MRKIDCIPRAIRKNKRFEIYDTHKDWDGITSYINNTDRDIYLKIKVEWGDEYTEIPANDYIIDLADETGREKQKALYKGKFEEITKEEYKWR